MADDDLSLLTLEQGEFLHGVALMPSEQRTPFQNLRASDLRELAATKAALAQAQAEVAELRKQLQADEHCACHNPAYNGHRGDCPVAAPIRDGKET